MRWSKAKREIMARRRIMKGGTNKAHVDAAAFTDGLATSGVSISNIDETRKGTGRQANRHRTRMASVSTGKSQFYNASHSIGNAITNALDPTRANGKVRTLADMTPEERAELERQYGAKISQR